MNPANGRNSEALKDFHRGESARGNLQAGYAGEAEPQNGVVEAAREIARQPGIHRDFKAERHRIGEHQCYRDEAGPDEDRAAQVAAAARGAAPFHRLGGAAPDQIPGRNEERDYAEPKERAVVIGAEDAGQKQCADAGSDVSGAGIKSLGGADLVRVEPLRDVLDADHE